MSLHHLARDVQLQNATTSSGALQGPAVPEGFVFGGNGDSNLVLQVNIVLVSILLAFTLFALPRTAVRYSNRKAWCNGIALWSKAKKASFPSSKRSSRESFPSVIQYLENRTFFHKRSASAPLHKHHLTGSETSLLPSHTISPTQAHPPRHMRSWTTVVPALTGILDIRIISGFSFGQFLVVLIYLSVISYFAFVQANPFTYPERASLIAMCQIPIVIALATKNNIVGLLIAQGYEKLNFLHRYAGLVLAFMGNFHSLHYIYRWSLEEVIAQQLQVPSNFAALVAILAIDVMVLTSFFPIRNRFYRTFFYSHLIGAGTFIVAICLHIPQVLPYVIVAVSFYAIDLAARCLKTRMIQANITSIPQLKTTRIEIPQLSGRWRAGQHVRVRVMSMQLGIFGWLESHAFTIASASEDGQGLVLMCKSAGAWTGRLYRLATSTGGRPGKLRVMVEGPYGGSGNTIFASFSSVLLIAGGSGISFAMATLQEIMSLTRQGRSRVKEIKVIWSIQDPAGLTPLLPLFKSILEECDQFKYGLSITISVHYTRAIAQDAKEKNTLLLSKDLELVAGRPNVAAALELMTLTVAQNSAVYGEPPSGLLVGVCGPTALTDSVANTVHSIDSARQRWIGGVELHVEAFGT